MFNRYANMTPNQIERKARRMEVQRENLMRNPSKKFELDRLDKELNLMWQEVLSKTTKG